MRPALLAAAATLVARGLAAQFPVTHEPEACTTDPFLDVPSASPTCPWIQQAAEDGILNACEGTGTLFCPGNAVTREQLAVDVERALRGRVWGQGRPGTVAYGTGGVGSGLCISGIVGSGLSLLTTTWEGAAAACPMGTWVCTLAEVGLCDTARPDSATCDERDCNANCLNRDANNHDGWVADAGGPGAWSDDGGSNVWGRSELGSQFVTLPCYLLPVWCCSILPP